MKLACINTLPLMGYLHFLIFYAYFRFLPTSPTSSVMSPHPPAPDGGWGWVVVFASFVIQSLTIGITYTFGILFVELLDVFDAGESTTAWIGSIQPALLYMTGMPKRGSR